MDPIEVVSAALIFSAVFWFALSGAIDAYRTGKELGKNEKVNEKRKDAFYDGYTSSKS